QSTTNPNSAGGNVFLFCSVTAGDAPITSLKYLNTYDGTVETVIGGAGTTAGALVYFNPTSGAVEAVLPYSANRSVGASGRTPSVTQNGDTVVLRGYFTGVWDGKGENRAPAGAQVVRFNAKT